MERPARVLSVLAVLFSVGCMDRDVGPIRPVTHTGIVVRPRPFGTTRVDIVVLVDNSGSMQQEQEALTERFGDLIRGLVDPPDSDGNGIPDWAAVEDLNIGVVSSDMGTMGYTGRTLGATCRNPDAGDDGCFRHDPGPAVPGCGADYAPFLSRNRGNAEGYTVDRMAEDFRCIATLGTAGCGFEQQLKAVEKAVTTNAAPGACNAGFLRRDSIIALLVVTDENDCSVANPEIFDEGRTDLGCMNLRCFYHPDFLEPVERYAQAFRGLRPGDPDKVLLAMIVGVPLDPACDGRSGDQLGACLSLGDMQERVDPDGACELVPSCDTDMGLAYPPTRLVRLAQAWGRGSIVSSICRDDWSATISRITGLIGDRLPPVCSARQLEFVAEDPNDEAASGVPDRDCAADCMVIETLGGDDPARPCPEDPSCPQAWCPAAAADDPDSAPCVNPATGETCEPFKRDLGCTNGDTACAGSGNRRQCLVRQASRTYDMGAGTCGEPSDRGWYYAGTGSTHWGCDDPPCVAGCPELVLRSSSELFVDDGSDVVLRCLTFLCPADRACGSEGQPTAGCCADDQMGTLGADRSMGSCKPKACPAGTVPAPAACMTGGETAGACVPG